MEHDEEGLILVDKGGHYGTERTDDCVDRVIYTIIEAEFAEEKIRMIIRIGTEQDCVRNHHKYTTGILAL